MPEQKAGEPRYVYRLPPCPAYDVEGTESWLSEMAEKGFVLTRDGFFEGFENFKKTEPQPLRYRLEASEKQLGAFSEACPPEEAEELYAPSAGAMFAHAGSSAFIAGIRRGRELNSDPVCRRSHSVWCAARGRQLGNDFLLWLLAYPLLSLRSGIVRTALALGTQLVFLLFAVIAWSLVRSIRKVVHLHRLSKSLSEGNPLDHGKDWRAHAFSYRAGKLLYPLLWLVLILCFLGAWTQTFREQQDPP